MRAHENERLTQVAPNTPAGQLLRRFWHPIALTDEFDPQVYPDAATRPVRALEVLGQPFVLFKDAQGHYGLLDRHCPHRGADLSFGRLETHNNSRWGEPSIGLRCPFHGWKFDTQGRCLDTPAEPEGSRLCDRVQANSYTLKIVNGVIWAWLARPANEANTLASIDGLDNQPPPLPNLDFLNAPDSHTFAFRGIWNCNWLQAQEVGLDPAHVSFLHAFFEDEVLETSYGKQFRAASVGDVDGERWPMTRIMREFYKPDIRFEPTAWGNQITTLRTINRELTHLRVTHGLFPNGFVIPLSETMTITQFHVPISRTRTQWVSMFTSFAEPINKAAMRNHRLKANPAPTFEPIKGRSNQWGYNLIEQQQSTLLGMGQEDINVHDQWACESMGEVSDRTREHLGTTDKVIIANRRQLSAAIQCFELKDSPQQNPHLFGFANPNNALRLQGPDTIDGIAPANNWQMWWQEQVKLKRSRAPWS
jgi:phthalate 4,5-dioxygenase